MKSVLNVGGGPRKILLPPRYAGWKQDLLDIDPAVSPDLCMDAREMSGLPPATYDAIFCSHNLEHYHRRDAVKVLAGFRHVLKPDGFAEIAVPDLGALIRKVAAENLDMDDVLYKSPAGPIQVRDVIYGYHVEIERHGNEFYTHKSGYTKKSLTALLAANGFPFALVAPLEPLALLGFFFRQPPSPDRLRTLGFERMKTKPA